MTLFGLFGPPDIKRLKEKRDIKALVKASRNDDSKVRHDAALALEELGVEAVVAAFITEAKKHPGEDVGTAVIMRAEILRGEGLGPRQVDHATAGRVERPKTTAESDLRWMLVQVLKSFGLPAVDALLDQYQKHDLTVDKNLEWALTEMGTQVAKALVPRHAYLDASGTPILDAKWTTILAAIFGESETEDFGPLYRKIASSFPELTGFLVDHKLLGEQEILNLAPKETMRITLWVAEEQDVRRVMADQYFLAGVLIAEGSSASKSFLEALNRRGTLSYTVSHNATKGGYDVTIVHNPWAFRPT